MGIVNFILNLAGLLLWLNWRAEKADPVGKRKPATLIGTLRRADSKSRNWQLPSLITGLIFLRAIFYWQIGSAARWSGKLDLGAIVLSFPIPTDKFSSLGETVLFSVSSFALTLASFYLCLLLLSILNGPEPFRIFVRMQLGGIDRWPLPAKLFLPFIAISIVWWMASRVFAWLQIIPQPVSEMARIGESTVVGLQSYLAWQYVAVTLLVLYLLNSYIYFGKSPFWNFVNAEAQMLLTPLKKIPLHAGKADFAPVVEIALVFLIARFAARALVFLYARLSF